MDGAQFAYVKGKPCPQGKRGTTMDFMVIKATRRTALANGFLRGLASPLLIYSSFTLPIEARPQFQKVKNPAETTDGVKGDWKRVGAGLKSAIKEEATLHG